MDKLNLTVNGEKREIEKGSTYAALARKIEDKPKYKPMAALVGNELKELGSVIDEDVKEVSFIDVRDADGMRIYHRTVSMIMLAEAKKLLGDGVKIAIEHSINKSLYCEIRREGFSPTEEFVEKLKENMRKLIDADKPITKKSCKIDKAGKLISQFDMEDKLRLFKYRNQSYVNLYCLDGYYDYFYGYMAPSTGYIDVFDLRLYENGFIIIMPDEKDPSNLWEFKDYKKISSVFMEQMEWGKLMRVECAADLNDIIMNGKFGELVRINEALHEKKIAAIADMIAKKRDKIKVALIAGPSSSGKTTFCQRLCIQLRVNGITPRPISLDDYFIDRDKTPVDEFGKKDFENINVLDVKQFNEDMNDLIAGKSVIMPRYNFITGKREYNNEPTKLGEGEIFVIEGIHGLNDALTENIASENKFKIFISAMTQLNLDAHNRISTADSRLIRRIVRDNQFRSMGARETIGGWDYVTRGEDKNIFPFQESADVMFNSATIYELSVLKVYIEPLLHNIPKSAPEYRTANRLLKFLSYFIGVNSDVTPNNSIIKEFIGGSCFS